MISKLLSVKILVYGEGICDLCVVEQVRGSLTCGGAIEGCLGRSAHKTMG